MSYDFAIYQKVGVEKYKRQSHHDMDEERDTSLEKKDRIYDIKEEENNCNSLASPDSQFFCTTTRLLP